MRWLALLVATLAADAGLTGDALAQRAGITCDLSMSAESCYRLLLGEGDAVAVADVADRTEALAPGIQLGGASTESTIHDFLPRVGVALALPGLREGVEALALKFNEGLAGFGAQAGVQIVEPSVYGPLLVAVPEDRQPDAEVRLKQRLEDHDAIDLSLAVNLESRLFGRRMRPHRAMVRQLIDALVPPPPQDLADAGVALARLLVQRAPAEISAARSDAADCLASADYSEIPMSCFNPDFSAELMSTVRSSAAELDARLTANRRFLETSGLDAIAALLGNQPQIIADLSYGYRSPLTGPDQAALSLRFEYGHRNLNWLRSRCGGTIDPGCLQTELADPDLLDGIARSRRVFVQVEAALVSTYEIDLPAESVALQQPRSLKVEADVGFGQYFGAIDDDSGRSRIDAVLSGVLTEANDIRNDRIIGKINYTLPLSSQFSGVVGVVWASRPEFVGDVDRTLGSNIGVSYRLGADEE